MRLLPSVSSPAATGCVFSVELPGIEPAAKGLLTCGNVAFDDAKQREMT
jgi:hypothetical protein